MTATQNYVVNPDKSTPAKPLIIKNLVKLKFVLFIFIGGIGCLFPFLPLHMTHIILNRDESKIITIIAGLVSALGPLILCPIADNLAQRKGATGKHLRILTAFCMIAAAVLYAFLLLVPNLERFEDKRPTVTFGCDSNGAIIFQQRIEEQHTCYHWDTPKTGKIMLSNCSYTCQTPVNYEKLYKLWEGSPYPPTEATASNETDEVYDENAAYGDVADVVPPVRVERSKEVTEAPKITVPQVEPPHMCMSREGQPPLCYAYIEGTQNLVLTATLRSALNRENDTHSAEYCKYPLDNYKCNIPAEQIEYMHQVKNTTDCESIIECEIYDPYNSPDNVLQDTLLIGNVDETYWSYLIIRIFGDLFLAAAIALLNAAIIIATRETSTGRGDVGHQLVWAAVGWALFSPIVGAVGPHEPSYLIPIVIFCVLSLVAALTLLIATDLPLSPPEWWWHTKSGMVAIPMSAIRKYGLEITALVFITFLLGICWSVMDSYQGWFIYDLVKGAYSSSTTTLLITLTLTVGAFFALPFLWYVEKIVDYCGHSNILISSFVFYTIRFSIITMLDEPWLILLMEAIEPLTLGLTWITIVLYTRHLVPRRLTATGQALPVAAHFCIGKAVGAIIGFGDHSDYTDDFGEPITEEKQKIVMFRNIYTWMAAACLIVAALYFVLYHLIFAPRCGAKRQPPPPEVLQGMRPIGLVNPSNTNTNGNYTPLRVYHDGRARKGHFRY